MINRIKDFTNKENVILLAYGGSHAYGTNNENSDIDLRGIAVNSTNELFSMDVDKKPYVDVETDTTIYYLFQMFQLLTNCNPNTIEILGCRPEHYFILTDEGKMILNNRDIFLSKKAAYSFGGYANQQLRRLQNALAHDEYPQAEKERHILGTTNSAMIHLKSAYTPFTDDNFKIYLDDSTKEELEKEVFIDAYFKHYPLRDYANVHSEMLSIVKGYDKLNHRNNKKDIPHLLKHAMHLVRLYLMSTDILKHREINTYRKEKDFLLDIRNGKYTYDEIFKMADEYEIKMQELVKTTKLPDEPNYKAINDLKIKINKRVLGIG